MNRALQYRSRLYFDEKKRKEKKHLISLLSQSSAIESAWVYSVPTPFSMEEAKKPGSVEKSNLFKVGDPVGIHSLIPP